MIPRKKCKCGVWLKDFPDKAPEFMVMFFAYCPSCKVVYYLGENM